MSYKGPMQQECARPGPKGPWRSLSGNWWGPGRQHCDQEHVTVITEEPHIPGEDRGTGHPSLSGSTRLDAEQAAGLQMGFHPCPSPPLPAG